MTWVASNLVHGRIGRMWMSVRDMDLAAELIGIRLLRAKLLAFAVSSFYCGVAGAMMVFLWYGGAEAEVFAIDQSFLVLFMVIIGGLGNADRLVLRRRPDLHLADCAAGGAGGLRPADPPGGRRAVDLRDRRRLDHRLSGARAERARPAVANWQAEVEGVALSLLMVHTPPQIPAPAASGRAGTPRSRWRDRGPSKRARRQAGANKGEKRPCV